MEGIATAGINYRVPYDFSFFDPTPPPGKDPVFHWNTIPLSQYGDILTKSAQSGGNFSVRALLQTEEDDVVLVLNRGKKQKFQLPGGGVENGEDPHNAIRREAREELERITNVYIYKIPFLITKVESKTQKYGSKINIWYKGRCTAMKPKSIINDSWITPDNKEIEQITLVHPIKRDDEWDIGASMSKSHFEALKKGLDTKNEELGQFDTDKNFSQKIYEYCKNK